MRTLKFKKSDSRGWVRYEYQASDTRHYAPWRKIIDSSIFLKNLKTMCRYYCILKKDFERSMINLSVIQFGNLA